MFFERISRIDKLGDLTKTLTQKKRQNKNCNLVTRESLRVRTKKNTRMKPAQLSHRPTVDLLLEKNYMVYRIPITNPTPSVELRFITGKNFHSSIWSQHLQ
jgi:hypothetical protein